MSLTMYDASIPVYQSMLTAVTHVLKKGQINAKERDIDEQVFFNARLAPDMHPLSRQIQIAADLAKGGAARLAGVDIPSWEDNESSFADLHARLAKTLEFVSGFEKGDIDGSETREIKLKIADQEMEFTGQAYLLHFNFPNFYFHVTTTYSILRSQGVPLSKRDYFGRG